MIPLRLHLRNFLSYGDSCEPIDFGSVHVACLCGPNGHGKSALLDAITWCLWGQARSNSADDLVRLGQPAMQVELEFLLEGQRYRVLRKRQRGKGSQSDLQLQVRQDSGDDDLAWRALTGQGVRGTQERINSLLRMDYETFINSAFILQGRADEFARKTSGDRKRILGEILSLNIYDQLAESARSRRAEAQVRMGALEAQVAQMESEHARLPALESEAARLTMEHAGLQVETEKTRAKLQGLLAQKARLDARSRERDDLLRRLQRAEAELAGVRQQLAAIERGVPGSRKLVARAAEIRSRAQEAEALGREREALTAQVTELRRLEQEQNLLERQLQQAQHALQTKLQLARQRQAELRRQTDGVAALEREAERLATEVEALNQLQEQRVALQTKLEALAAERAAAEADHRRYGEELALADERFQLLKAAQAICPLCEGELPEQKRLDLGRALREERKALKDAQEAAVRRQSEATRGDASARRALNELDGQLKKGQALRDRLAQARLKLGELAQASALLPAVEEEVATVAALLTANEFEPEVRSRLAEAQARVKGLGYDPARHEQLTRRIGQLGGADRELHTLEAAETSLPEELRQADSLREAVRLREEGIAEDRAARAEADRELAGLPALEAQANELQSRLNRCEATEADLGRRVGAACEARERCAGLAEQITERRSERDAAARDQSLYAELGKAFGRNGIQALIIENALPEIEGEANNLLARMSDGQLTVRLNTQRALKSGEQAETLEIEISDGLGARKYELYSGGEAFRVNFAIRIALSKLLARRAGARLETLVIDEGFGSQDAEGRERLVEAIHAIQDDFAKILVITHIEDLKDVFPTRIEVTKGPLGSQVTVH
ncbi:MAG: AAA family ATPase [Actinomycetota bacterium]